MSVEAVAAIVTCVFSVGGMIFVAGKTSGKVHEHDVRLNQHDERFNAHGDRLSELELSQAETKGWRRGFETGQSHKQGGTT